MLHRQITSSTAASWRLSLGLLGVLLALLFPVGAAGQAVEQPIVQCVLFYSPTCPHCHMVITELLIPMQEQYGEQLQIIGIDTSNPVGGSLYSQAVEHFGISQQRQGVPTLIIGQTVLVGSGEIPAEFPKLVEDGLIAEGVGWPDIPGLALAIPDLPPSADPAAGLENSKSPTPEPSNEPNNPDMVSTPAAESAKESLPKKTHDGALDEALAATATEQGLETEDSGGNAPESIAPPADPLGFSLAGLTLFGMAGALVYVAQVLARPPSLLKALRSANYNLSLAVPILALLGVGVALYLSYVEVTQVEAICGPVGECNIVQSSSYARVLGIPVAVLGVLSYVAVILFWIGQRILEPRLSALSLSGLVTLTIFSTLFSIYLTVLELFIIKAVCAWCLSSAVLTALMMVLVTRSWQRDSANRN